MTGFPAELEELRRRLDLLGDRPLGLAPAGLVQDLETAYEELRAADEEVRCQQEQIAALVEGYDAMQHHHERLLAVLPVPVLVTDQQGVIGGANVAAAGFLRMRLGRLIGKPALSFVAPEDRGSLRTILSRGLRGGTSVRALATATPREGGPVSVEITLHQAQPATVTWMLLSAGTAAEPVLRSLPEALAALATVSATCSDLHAALEAAAALVAGTLVAGTLVAGTLVAGTSGEGVAVSLSVGAPLEPRTVASSSVLAQQLDGAQMMAGEGPCQTAFETNRLVESADLTRDDRWPSLATRVADEVGAIAVPLTIGGEPFGCLNVYCPAHLLEARVVQACELFAATVAAIVHDFESRAELASLASGLRQALESRAVIEQAKGAIMAARRYDADAAFAHLVELSSTRHLKLREVARQIVSELATP